jgi:hypothetical protein
MKGYAVIIIVLALAILGGLWAVTTRTAVAPVGQGCTMEAKLCPDGSAVGRTGPNCEFTECPAVATTTSGGGGGSILPYHSGVRGTVSLGPTCPVMRNPPDPQCADRPYSTNIAVYRTGASTVFATGKSNASGAFEFSLPPGSYTLVISGATMMLPRCNDTNVTVLPDAYVTTAISCDTGIR